MTLSETEKLKFENITKQWSRRERAIFLMGMLHEAYELDGLLSKAEPPDEEKASFVEAARQVQAIRMRGIRRHLRNL